MIPQKLIDKGIYWSRALSLVEGCTPVSEACKNCWLKAMHKRFNPDIPFENVRIREDRLNIPLKTRKPQVFAIWSDLFWEQVPFEFVDKVFETIRNCPHHTFLILTKRAVRMNNYLFTRVIYTPSRWIKNLWVGITVENQEQADKLLKCCPFKLFLSIEPMLGPIDLRKYLASAIGENYPYRPAFSQVICGSESGTNRRQTNIEWVANLVRKCNAVGVPIFIKQLLIDGKTSKDMNEWPVDLRRRDLVWRK